MMEKNKAVVFLFLLLSGFLLGIAMAAYGAAGEGGILRDEDEEETDQYILIDVSPISLGIETAGGVMTDVIPIKTFMPARRSQIFTTCEDQQTTVSIKVYEGERSLTKDCRELGRFDLSSIAPAPRGVPQIEVTFDLDANGILLVKAEDKATKKSESRNIYSNYVRQLVNESENLYLGEGRLCPTISNKKRRSIRLVSSRRRQREDQEHLGG